MWLINTYGNGAVLSDVFRSIVFLMGGGYESLLRLGMVCLVFGVIVSYLGRGRVHWQLAVGAVMILAVTMNIRTTIIVHDLVNPTNPDQVIASVPIAVAFPAYLTSEISYQTMVGIETSFGLPAEYRVVNSTIGKGFFDMQKTFSLELVPGDLQANVTRTYLKIEERPSECDRSCQDQNVSRDIPKDSLTCSCPTPKGQGSFLVDIDFEIGSNYIKDCVFPAIQLNRLNRETVLDSADMVAAIQVNVAALVTREVLLGNPAGEITCPDLWDRWVRLGLANGEADYDETMRQFRAVLGVQDVADAELAPVQAFAMNIIGTAQSPRVLINNVLLRERWKNAEEAYAQDGSDTASAVVQMTRSLSEDLKNQAYNDSMVAARFVPLIRTVSESAVYLLTPLMLALAMTPAMFSSIRGVVVSYGWLFMWIPMYAIFNFVTFQYGVQQMNMITVNQVTFNSYDQYYDVLLGLNTFMARLVWAVPTLATVVTYGMSSAASSLTGAASGAQAAASQEASAYAHGEGRYVEPGQHLRLEEGPMVQDASGGYHAGASYFGGGTGTKVYRQDGTTSYSYSNGGLMVVGRNGVESYHGPEGSWSRQDGVYQAGVWRQEVQDPNGGRHLAQFEVSGDHVDVSYMKRDGHGVQHDIRETWNQSMNEQKSVIDTWSEGGISKEILTHGDRSQTAMFKGTAPVPMEVNGRTKMVSAEVSGSFYRPSNDSPWGQGVMTAHSTEHGDFHYSLSNADMDDQGFPDLNKGVTVSSSHGTDQKTMLSSDHGLFTATTEGERGELTRMYSGQSDVEVFHKDGTHETLLGVVHGQGGVNEDGSGKSFQSSLTVDKDGYRGELRGEMSYNQQQGRWEMYATNEDWSARLEAHSSGMMMRVGDLQLVGGHLQKYGGRDSQNWSYTGPVIDGNNVVSRGHVESKDGQVFFSDLDHGGTQRVIGDGGRQLTLRNNPGSSDYTYEETFTAPAWLDDGHGNLKPIGQTHFTSHGHATVDPEKSGSLFDRLIRTPDTTTAVNKGAFGERSLAVSLEPRPLSELPVGSGKLTLDGLGSDGSSDLKGGEGTGYVIFAGAGSQKFNSIETVQNVQGADGQKKTQRLNLDGSLNPVSGFESRTYLKIEERPSECDRSCQDQNVSRDIPKDSLTCSCPTPKGQGSFLVDIDFEIGSSVIKSWVVDYAGNLHLSTLGRGGDGTGNWRVLTSETTNRNSFSGTFLVPGLDGNGTVRVAGGIEMSPEGDIVSMHFTNTATGKQIGYRDSEHGPVFTVGDVDADPNQPGKFRLTNEREVSHREAESAGGFVVRDVLNQAGERIWSEGYKGIERRESRAYQLNTKIDEQSTMVSKGQQSLEALGVTQEFNPDDPGGWKDAARTAEGVRLGWDTSMNAIRIWRFNRSVDKIGGEKPRPYDPRAPIDPDQRAIYDKINNMVKDFEKQRGITRGK